MAQFADLKGRVLDYVNKIRSRYGAPTLAALPMGTRGEASACPIANALTFTGENGAVYADVFGSSIQFRGAVHETVKGPQYLNEFVEAFDEGKIPSLVDPDAPMSEEMAYELGLEDEDDLDDI